MHGKMVITDTEALMDAFLMEFRIACCVIEKVFEGDAERFDGKLRCAFGDFQHPGEMFAFYGIELLSKRRLIGLAACRILCLPFRQGPVVGKTRRAASTGQVSGLHIVRCKLNLMGMGYLFSSTAFLQASRIF